MPRLERFKIAQSQPGSGFDSALAELRSGRKRGHWIWYVFPQLAGLGSSSLAHTYGIDGIAEAVDYLRDPVLRDRLLIIATAVGDQVETGKSLEHLMGSSIDVMKLVSSLTLFGRVAARLHGAEGLDAYRSLADVASAVLAVAKSEGYPPCAQTLARLEREA